MRTRRRPAPPGVHLPYSLLFLSTDGAVYGGLGAARFAAHAPEAPDVIAVVNLDAIAGPRPPRLELDGRHAALAARPASSRRSARSSPPRPARDPRARARFGSSIDLGFPYSRYEQAPFVTRGIPAVTITTAGDRPRERLGDTAARLRATRLGQIGRATQNVIDALQQGSRARARAVELRLSRQPHRPRLGGRARARRDAAAVPRGDGRSVRALPAAADPVAPALRSYRSRLGFWAWCGALFALFALLGVWPDGAPGRRSLDGVAWPLGGLAALAVLAGSAGSSPATGCCRAAP